MDFFTTNDARASSHFRLLFVGYQENGSRADT